MLNDLIFKANLWGDRVNRAALFSVFFFQDNLAIKPFRIIIIIYSISGAPNGCTLRFSRPNKHSKLSMCNDQMFCGLLVWWRRRPSMSVSRLTTVVSTKTIILEHEHVYFGLHRLSCIVRICVFFFCPKSANAHFVLWSRRSEFVLGLLCVLTSQLQDPKQQACDRRQRLCFLIKFFFFYFSYPFFFLIILLWS